MRKTFNIPSTKPGQTLTKQTGKCVCTKTLYKKIIMITTQNLFAIENIGYVYY